MFCGKSTKMQEDIQRCWFEGNKFTEFDAIVYINENNKWVTMEWLKKEYFDLMDPDTHIFIDEAQFINATFKEWVNVLHEYRHINFHLYGLHRDCFNNPWDPFDSLRFYVNSSNYIILSKKCTEEGCTSGLRATINKRTAGHTNLEHKPKEDYKTVCVECFEKNPGDAKLIETIFKDRK